jgi:hypothetical protein
VVGHLRGARPARLGQPGALRRVDALIRDRSGRRVRRARVLQGAPARAADHHWPADRAGRVPLMGSAFEGNRAETKTMLRLSRRATCRPGPSTTTSATPSRPTSPSSSPPSTSAGGPRHRQAGQSGSSSAATAPSRSRPDGRPSPPPTRSRRPPPSPRRHQLRQLTCALGWPKLGSLNSRAFELF